MSEKHTDTPRTDAEVERRRLLRYHGTPEKEPKVGADFARQLESELDEARVKLDQWPTKYAQAMDLWTDDNVRNNETITQLRAVAEGLAESLQALGKIWHDDECLTNKRGPCDCGAKEENTERLSALAAYEAWKGGAAISSPDELKPLFDWLDYQCYDLRCENVPSMDDAEQMWVVYSHYMAEPQLRAEGYGKDPASAIRDAMLPKNDPGRMDYCPPDQQTPQAEQEQQDGQDFQTGHIGWSPDYNSKKPLREAIPPNLLKEVKIVAGHKEQALRHAKESPSTIYLQWHGEGEPDESEPANGEVSWCKDKIFQQDVAYVKLADVLPQLKWHKSMAKQKLTHEMDEETKDAADYEGAYELIVEEAREALAYFEAKHQEVML